MRTTCSSFFVSMPGTEASSLMNRIPWKMIFKIPRINIIFLFLDMHKFF